jgi:heptaprenyl diphosphate synthase/octaprenyl-diphosphate synthase
METIPASEKTRPDLNQIYAPVQKDLITVEAKLQSTKSVALPHLAALLDHILKGDGKRIRPALTLLAGKFFDYRLDKLVPMATALELLHTATLVHDDAIDHSLVRRNRPTVNKLWGEEQAVLLGDYLFAEAGSLTASTDNLRVIKLFSNTLKIISSGELDQSINAFSLDQTKDKYFKRIAQKTATLFTTSTESGASLSSAPEPAIQQLIGYGHNLGIAFQVIDDILDFTGLEKDLGKPTGSDLAQGTITLPVLLLLDYFPNESAVKMLFRDHNNPEVAKAVIDVVRNSPKILDQCYITAISFSEKAIRCLESLPENAAKDSLKDLADYIVHRKR